MSDIYQIGRSVEDVDGVDLHVSLPAAFDGALIKLATSAIRVYFTPDSANRLAELLTEYAAEARTRELAADYPTGAATSPNGGSYITGARETR